MALGLTQPQWVSLAMMAAGTIWLVVRRPVAAPASARRLTSGAVPATASHLYPEASSVEDGRLRIGGCDAVELAREFGTPLYAVAEDDLRARAREFRAAMGDGEVVFASKAFPCTAVLRVFEEEGLAVDVASGGELALALKAGFSGRRIILHGNAKSAHELRAAANAGARIVVDNFDEIDKLDRIAAPVEVMIRVTPGVVADTHAAILTGHAGSKFGFSLSDAPRAIERLRAARPGPTCAASTSTSARSSSTSRRGGSRSRRSPPSATSAPTTSAAGSPSRTRQIAGRRPLPST